jgi:hypothetical protein
MNLFQRLPLKENKAELAANLSTPKNVRKRRNPVRRFKKEEDEVPAICEVKNFWKIILIYF